MFPGQGAQTVGMGRELYGQLPQARHLFDRAGQVLGYDLAKICFEGPAEELDSTIYSQPALFVASLAALEKLQQQSPDVVDQCGAAAGLSLGEYTALVFAGAMDFETGLRVVQRRGEAMQRAADAAPSGMVSVLGMDRAEVQQLCEQYRQSGEVLQIANLLCPGNIVVSGHRDSCEQLAAGARNAGAMRVVPLAVAGAFHTPLMESAVGDLQQALQQAMLREPRVPVVSNVDARPHVDPEEIRRLLARQVVQPVEWEASMHWLIDQGCETFYEVGPGRVLRGLLKRIERKIPCFGVMDG
jgi:[acyl-carrier-protein] S-malonyltransferase